jgi:hypothetical protein
METKIEVTVRSVYGEDRVYPHNEQARLLAALVGTKTLTSRTLELAQALGFEIEEVLGKRTLSTLSVVSFPFVVKKRKVEP